MVLHERNIITEKNNKVLLPIGQILNFLLMESKSESVSFFFEQLPVPLDPLAEKRFRNRVFPCISILFLPGSEDTDSLIRMTRRFLKNLTIFLFRFLKGSLYSNNGVKAESKSVPLVLRRRLSSSLFVFLKS